MSDSSPKLADAARETRPPLADAEARRQADEEYVIDRRRVEDDCARKIARLRRG